MFVYMNEFLIEIFNKGGLSFKKWRGSSLSCPSGSLLVIKIWHVRNQHVMFTWYITITYSFIAYSIWFIINVVCWPFVSFVYLTSLTIKHPLILLPSMHINTSPFNHYLYIKNGISIYLLSLYVNSSIHSPIHFSIMMSSFYNIIDVSIYTSYM